MEPVKNPNRKIDEFLGTVIGMVIAILVIAVAVISNIEEKTKQETPEQPGFIKKVEASEDSFEVKTLKLLEQHEQENMVFIKKLEAKENPTIEELKELTKELKELDARHQKELRELLDNIIFGDEEIKPFK